MEQNYKRNYFQERHLKQVGLTGSNFYSLFSIFCILLLTGCQSTGGNVGRLHSYSMTSMETAWIRNGEPIEFEGASWYPQDGVEGFRDSEMHLLGEHRGVQFFADKVDIRPYDRLYTKFDRNKFRFFTKGTGQ